MAAEQGCIGPFEHDGPQFYGVRRFEGDLFPHRRRFAFCLSSFSCDGRRLESVDCPEVGATISRVV